MKNYVFVFADFLENFLIYFSSCFAPLWRLWKNQKTLNFAKLIRTIFFLNFPFGKFLVTAVSGWMIFLGSVLGVSWREFCDSKLKAFLCVLELSRFRILCTNLFNYNIIYISTLSHNQIPFSISIIKPNSLFCHNSLNFL